MRKIILSVVASSSLLAAGAFAGDMHRDTTTTTTHSDNYNNLGTTDHTNTDATDTTYNSQSQEAGTAASDSMTSSTTTDAATGGYLKNEAFGIKPQAGVVLFQNNVGDTASRLAVGFTLDWNVTRVVSESPDLYIGPSTGFIFSHLGSTTGNFFGTSLSGQATAGANMFYIPANLKIGANMGRDTRLSVHGGGNVFYRSVAAAINLGAATSAVTNVGSSWDVYPNAGADLEIGFGKNAALLIRPDITFTPGVNVYSATIGFAAPLG